MTQMLIRRGDIYWVDFDPSKGTEIRKARPSVICSHDLLNENSSRIIVTPITSNLKRIYSFEYEIKNHPNIVGKVMCDQMRAIDKSRLNKKEISLTFKQMNELDLILKLVMGLQ